MEHFYHGLGNTLTSEERFVLSDTFNAEVRKNYSNGLLYDKLRNTGGTVAMSD